MSANGYSRTALWRKAWQDSRVQRSASLPSLMYCCNSDESDYRNGAGELSYIGNFHKGLPHSPLGKVDPAAYRALLKAVNSRLFEAFEAISLGLGRKLVNPQAGLAFDLQGQDSHEVMMPRRPGSTARRLQPSWPSSIGWRSCAMSTSWPSQRTRTSRRRPPCPPSATSAARRAAAWSTPAPSSAASRPVELG